ncbi:MAG: glucarate dehydratase family protein [Actinomycetota bacterium]|nr:glucarate dehydratase family protein [Actinomycetota bacterium]
MTRIARVTITPVAFRDPPLLNAVGIHEPYALRSIIQLHTDDGLVGLGESYGDDGHLERLRVVGEAMIGLDPFHTHQLRDLTVRVLGGSAGADTHGLTGHISVAGTALRTFASFEVACLDLQGKVLGRPVSDLLGGLVRDRVPFSAYLFYKWAGHPGAEPDTYGEALDPAGIVAQARWMIDTYGFGALKLKGGVFEPDQEVDAIVALREAFPLLPLRLDPNAAWSVGTSISVAQRLAGVLEYLEDPTPTRAGMAAVAREAEMPLATNMCVVGFEDIPDAIERGSVGVILSDHHYWGGLRASLDLAGICRTFDLGLSMHSNSHLGISLAAMTHLAGSVPNLTYALDTHWPWKDEDVIVPGTLAFVEGAVAVPTGPGLGIELDEDALARLHRQYLDCGLNKRDDTAYMKRFVADYEALSPRW